MMKPMTITELKRELKKMEQAELIQLISKLYKSNNKVKEIVNVQFRGEKYQEEILTSMPIRRKCMMRFFLIT